MVFSGFCLLTVEREVDISTCEAVSRLDRLRAGTKAQFREALMGFCCVVPGLGPRRLVMPVGGK